MAPARAGNRNLLCRLLYSTVYRMLEKECRAYLSSDEAFPEKAVHGDLIFRDPVGFADFLQVLLHRPPVRVPDVRERKS